MNAKNIKGDHQQRFEQQQVQMDKREKKHEDDLLRKLQQEKMKDSFSTLGNNEDKEIYREHFEDRLLNKLMDSLTSDNQVNDRFSKHPGELLMITSAVTLTDSEKEAIVRKFIEKTNKPLRRITTVVDPTLITGIRLQSESFYYEVSGQKTLRELRRHLERNWL